MRWPRGAPHRAAIVTRVPRPNVFAAGSASPLNVEEAQETRTLSSAGAQAQSRGRRDVLSQEVEQGGHVERGVRYVRHL